ncbi:N-acetylmuramate alpha-1-phosphate uridylyltransferase MurU [Pseudoxanthomonas sp. SE1]|uniref:N-acetylmuramate alpha-1-phosphate uridylyltransferase MurU n=1 Tax=Pseudoxanthomonas sp. SE1 TaxID=1664560 RepID=UPI00240CE8F4|nr:nucleotidyltransferase family protein [Pseudoxanthomonas sp. SE1]WFC42790.1 nucleotidyltransferase family protein [Pseudoxanthomonas sp. SE1]
MKALIFAAGLGERMRPLTDHTPKPLIEAGGKPLIVWHLEKLAALGVRDVVINTSWLADRFPEALGDGERWGMRIHYLYEGDTPLETGGGMLNARPLLGEAPFLLVNGDIWTDFDFARLPREPQGLAHLVMVEPPAFAPRGDFALDAAGQLHREGEQRLTYAGLGLYRPTLLDPWQEHITGELRVTTGGKPRFPLLPLLHAGMAAGRVTGERLQGRWTDVGTPQRLADLEATLSA